MPAKILVRKCCGTGAYMEGLYLVADAAGSGKKAFGQAPACTKCFKAIGDPVLEGKPPKGWSTTSWAAMLHQHPLAPFNFKLFANGHLLPETYKEKPKAQLETPVTTAQALELAEADREEP